MIGPLVLCIILPYITAKEHKTSSNDLYYDYSEVDNANTDMKGMLNTGKERNTFLNVLDDLEQHMMSTMSSDEERIENKDKLFKNFDEDNDTMEKLHLHSYIKPRIDFWKSLKNKLLFIPFTPLKEYTTRNNVQKYNKTRHASYNDRKIMGWFQNLFKTNEDLQFPTPKTTVSTGFPTTTNNPMNERSLETKLLMTLNELVATLEHINENIVKHDNLLKELMVLVAVKKIKPKTSYKVRSKRHAVNNTAHSNELSVLNTNETLEINNLNETNDAGKNKPTRRNLKVNEYDVIKFKLLSYLNDSFNEIKDKMIPLIKIKHDYSEDDVYRIGYIVANIDTLEVNLSKLRKDMEINRHRWNDYEILDLIDRLKVSNTVVNNLLQSLKHYVDKPRY